MCAVRFGGTRRRVCATVLFFFLFNLFELCMPPGGNFSVMGPKAAAASEPWDGVTIATAFAGGTGDAGDPYLIATGAQLAYLAELINDTATNSQYTSKYYKLTADIDLNDKDWTPIGLSVSIPFSSNFDGNGHVVSGMRIVSLDYAHNCAGLFGYVMSATIENIGVTDFTIDVEQGISVWAGGLAGFAGNETIRNSFASGWVSVSDDYSPSVGGLVGYADTATIQNSFATATVNAISSNGSASAGGLVGETDSTTTIQNSFATGEIFAESTNESVFVGGLVGLSSSTAISYSYATGNVSYTADATSKVAYVGGLVGNASSIELSNTFAIGDVQGSAYSSYAGGLVGYLTNPSSSLETSYSWGEVPDILGMSHGGLVGEVYWDVNASNVRYNFWRSTVNPTLSGIGTDSAGIAPTDVLSLDDTDFESQGNFTGWDFPDTWCYTPLDGGERPHLRAFFGSDTSTINPDFVRFGPSSVTISSPNEGKEVPLYIGGWTMGGDDSMALSPASFNDVTFEQHSDYPAVVLEAGNVLPTTGSTDVTVTFTVNDNGDGVQTATFSLLVIGDDYASADIDGVSADIGGTVYEWQWQEADGVWLCDVSFDKILNPSDLNVSTYPAATFVTATSGDDVIVTVTAPDGYTTETHTIRTNRLSNETAIRSITVTTNADSKVYAAVLSTDATAWEVRLPNTTSGDVSVDIVLSHDKATVTTPGLASYNLGEDNPLDITVRAEDGTIKDDYTLVALPLSTATAPTSVTVTAGSAEDTATAPLVASPDHYQLTLPYGADLSSTIVSIVLPAGAAFDLSIESPVDFSDGQAKLFTIVAEDGITSADYYLLAVNAPSNVTAVDEFSVTVDGTVYAAALQSDGTYLITLPHGADITSVNVDIVLPSGASIQPSGPYDFSNGPVTFTVTAADGTTETYTLAIEVKPAPSGPTTTASDDVVAEFYVRNVPLSPMKDGESADLYIQWKDVTDSLSPDTPARSRDVYPQPMPAVSWDILPPEGGGSWNVTVSADPDNPFSAHLAVAAKGNAQAGRERYSVVVHMKQSKGDETLYEETYTRGFYVGDPFPVVVTLSPEAQDEIDRVNAILARTGVEIIPGNHQDTIPAHILDLVLEHLREHLVTYAARGDGDGCGERFTAVRAGYTPNRASFEFEAAASGDVTSGDELEIFILEDIEAIRMAEKEPEPEDLPDCFDCTDKFSANIELDLTKLPASADGKIVMVPMSYTVTIKSNDMNDFYDPGRAWDIVENPTAHLDEIFDVLVLHKRIHEGAMEGWYTRLVRGVAQPQEAYDTGMLQVWSDKAERSLTISLGYYVINYHGESFAVKGPRNAAVSGDEIGYIILPDGLRNDILIDPLWTNVWRGSTGTQTGDSGGGGGCAAGAGLAAAIAALAALPFARRRGNRRK